MMSEGRTPDFVGNLEVEQNGFKTRIQIAAWKNTDKHGNPMLGINIGGKVVNLFENKVKEKPKKW